jgi:hypothetical protein
MVNLAAGMECSATGSASFAAIPEPNGGRVTAAFQALSSKSELRHP